MTSTPYLTVIILTLNEEANLHSCLSSVGFADDLVIVDSGSSDGTPAIAESCGARLYVHQQVGPFDIAAQRNWAMANCDVRAGWVFFLDADERATPALEMALKAAIETDSYDSFQLTPKYMFQGRWMRRSMGYPNWHDRLVNTAGPRFAGGVWEHFDDYGRTGRIAEPYLSYGNSKGFSDWLERHDRYSTHDAESIVRFLTTSQRSDFGTARKLRTRALAAHVWRLRPVLRFLFMYVVRGGFLDGSGALRFCLRYAFFEYMTVEKVHEMRRRSTGASL